MALAGPTGVGKSAVALALAPRLNAEIVVADSMQVYRGFTVGTGKPAPADRAAVPHHGLDLVPPEAGFDAAAFRAAAAAACAGIRARGRLPLVVAGTGLYLRALRQGLCEAPAPDPAVRRGLEAEARRLGTAALHARLRATDPEAAARLSVNDRVRVVRALEVFEQTGIPLSRLQAHHRDREGPPAGLVIGLTRAREDLTRRIDARVQAMAAAGLEGEVRGLLAAGGGATRPMRGLGYRHFAAVIRGEKTAGEAVRLMQRDTRRYAKRQLTWLRKEPGVLWLRLAPDEPAAVTAERILALLREQAQGETAPWSA
ncbi:MAG: tRNA (adenosine(37)-N6)-dimethylallyltransferase MiaA [candidate division NC10 bacterium]|nr:tRNA (adenosine(37)-N6)-dimethylallyltransferase MiaA [candidate division NC10 bacterium]